MTAPSEGFVYFCWGESHIDDMVESIRLLQRHSPGARICFLSNEAGTAYFERRHGDVKIDVVMPVPLDPAAPTYLFRTRLYALSPYDRTIHLDPHTYVTDDIRNLFDLMETFDFVAVNDEAHPARGVILGLRGGYAALNYYNCGFFIFRKSPACQKLFENWAQEYLALAALEPGDEGPLVRALIKTELRFITLPKEYNLRLYDKCASFQGRAKILHARARDPETLIRDVNAGVPFVAHGSRVWIPNLQRVVPARAFRRYAAVVRLFNRDNVQQPAGGRVPRATVAQNFARLGRRVVDAGRETVEHRLERLKPPVKRLLAWLRLRPLKPPLPGGFVTDLRRPHLGGNVSGGDRNSFDVPVFDHLIEGLAIKSFFDLGSGEGHCARYFEERGIPALALDGLAQKFVCANHAVHDLVGGPYRAERRFDVVWCCEVAEHIDPRYVGNFVETLTANSGRFILMTHGVPGQEGHHHVNLRDDWYWIQLITDRGFYFDPHLTLTLRAVSRSKYFRRTGLVFERIAPRDV